MNLRVRDILFGVTIICVLLPVGLVVSAPAPWQWPKTAIVGDFGAVLGGATPLNTSGGSLAYGGPTSGTVGTSSGVLVTAGAFRQVLTVQTLPGSTCNTWLAPAGGTAAVNAGALVQGGGGAFTFGTPAAPLPTANITAITDCGSPQTVLLVGG